MTISQDTQLTRDMDYHDLTVRSGGTLDVDGYVVRVCGTLLNYGTIKDTHCGTTGGLGGQAGVGGDPYNDVGPAEEESPQDLQFSNYAQVPEDQTERAEHKPQVFETVGVTEVSEPPKRADESSLAYYSEEKRARAWQIKKAYLEWLANSESQNVEEFTPETPYEGGSDYEGGIEDFEGAFPGSYWFVGDTNSSSGLDYWDDVSCRSYQGAWSGWCAGYGSQSPCTQYDLNMDAYMYVEAEYLGTSGGFNKMWFYLWSRAEDGFDWFQVEVEGYVNEPCHGTGTPDAHYYGPQISDTGWLDPWDLKLVTLPSDFDPCYYVRVRFKFHSDFSIVDGEGAYVDYIQFNNLPGTQIYPISGGFPAACTAPSGATANPAAICPGQCSTLSATGSPGSGCTFKWYAGGCGSGPVIGTGSSITVCPTTTTTYYVRADGFCGPTACASVTVTVTPACTAPSGATANPAAICPGQCSTLSATGSPGSGCTFKWYAAGCGSGPVIGTGSSITVCPTTTTTYYVRADGFCGPTACASVTVTVTPPCTAPSGATATPNPACPEQTVTLSATGGPGSGCTLKWYAGGCGSGQSIGSGPSIDISAPSSTTTYYVRAEGPCGPTACASVTLTITPVCLGACCRSAERGCLTDLTKDFCETTLGGHWAGPGTHCNDNPPPCDEGACCVLNDDCQDLYRFECAQQGGTFHLEIPCSPNPCPGACCIDGVCHPDMILADCAAASGHWLGAGTDCADPDKCKGACCVDETCVPNQTEPACLSVEGLWLGYGSTCGDPNPCLGACCVGPICVPNQWQTDCSSVGGIWLGPGSGCDRNPCVTVCIGDMNCDGVIGFGDINPFVLYMSNCAAWQIAYPGCPTKNGDINCDGSYCDPVDFGDINPFVALMGQCNEGCPCPGPITCPP